MGFTVNSLHDFLAFLVCLAIGIIMSFTQTLTISLSAFLLAYATWLLTTSPLVRVGYRATLDPRISRASLGGILLLVSMVTTATSVQLEVRFTALLAILIVAGLVLYIYTLSRKYR